MILDLASTPGSWHSAALHRCETCFRWGDIASISLLLLVLIQTHTLVIWLSGTLLLVPQVQCLTLSNGMTSGLSTIDYYVSTIKSQPGLEAQARYSESLVLLDSL